MAKPKLTEVPVFAGGGEKTLTQSQRLDNQQAIVEEWRTNQALFLRQACHYPKFKRFQLGLMRHTGSMKLGRRVRMKLLPRDSGKSWIDTVGKGVHRVVHDANTTGQIIAEAMGTSKLFLSGIQQQLRYNDTIHHYYGNHYNPSAWSTTRFISALRTSFSKEPTIEAFGAGGAIVGRHVMWQILDDLVSQTNSNTQDLRAKLVNWYYKVALPCLNMGGDQDFNGTRYFPTDMYGTLLNDFGDDILYRVPALTVTNDDEETIERKKKALMESEYYAQLLNEHEGEDLQRLHVEALGYESYFPERYSVVDLLQIRRINPVAFASQYQNETGLMTSGIFDAEGIIMTRERRTRSDQDELPPIVWPPFSEMSFVIGIDPARGLKERNDFFSTCTLGFHKTYKPGKPQLYVIRSTAKKLGSPEKMLTHVLNEWLLIREMGGQVMNVAVESTAFQGVLATAFREKGGIYGHLPITEYYPSNKTDKVQRTIERAHWVNLRKVAFDRDCAELITQLLQFPDADHNDRVDSFIIALIALVESTSFGFLGGFDVRKFNRRESGILTF